jgi:succinate dehydrogenase / fumarate reductase, membrane anchor subunit
MRLESPLARVLGRGSAKEGVHHWWVQRLTSVALVPLSAWLLFSLLSLPALDHATLVAWLRGGWAAVLMILLVVVGSWHSHLGVRVVVEDYVHGKGAKTALLVLVAFAHVLLAAAGTFAVLRVSFGGVS